MKIMLI